MPEQTLVKGKQSLVDLKDVIVSTLHEILHDDVKFVGVESAKPAFMSISFISGKVAAQGRWQMQWRWAWKACRTCPSGSSRRASGQYLPSCSTVRPSCRVHQSSAAASPKSSHRSVPVHRRVLLPFLGAAAAETGGMSCSIASSSQTDDSQGIGSSIRKAFILRRRSERLSVCSST